MKTMLSDAIKFAVEKHDGQFDKAGMPYILHCLKVMHYLKTEDEELMCIAILHDVIEDCFLGKTVSPSYDMEQAFHALRQIGMSNRVIEGVVALTRNGDYYEEYIANLMTNKDAILVKMADLRHNMDIRRLKGVTENDIKRIEKYAKTYEKLKEKLYSLA